MKRAYENLGRIVTTQAEFAVGDTQQARRAILNHLNPAALTKPEFGHSADPSSIAADIRDVRPFAGLQHVEWEYGT